jgi:proline-specific peptidase
MTLVGPGMAHDYLIPVSDLQKTRPVIFYDQLGNNRSTHLPEKPRAFWTIDLFVDELANLANHLGISSRYDVLGHSWGGMLASEFIIRRQPTGLRKLIIAGSLPSMELWNKSNENLRKELPQEVQDDLKDGFKDKIRYRKALEVYHSRNGCTINPPPKEITSGVLDPIFGDRETGEGGDPTVTIAMCVSDKGPDVYSLISCTTGTLGLSWAGPSLTVCTRSMFPPFS